MREFGSEFPAISLPDGYFDSFIDFGRELTYLRSGREALLYVSLNCKPSEETPVILLPAYSCWSMSAPFEKTGWRVIYYRLNEDLKVNLEYLDCLLNELCPAAILTMNFFGSASTNDAVAMVNKFCPSCLIIEDFSHCTFSIKMIYNPVVDYYVSSIRKSIGVCDGGVVISKMATDHSFIESEDSTLAELRYTAQSNKIGYNFSKDQNVKSKFLSEIRDGEGILNVFTTVHAISSCAQRMLALVNSKEIVFARKHNMEHLLELLEGKVKMVPGLARSLDGAPFSLPILVENRDELQGILAKRGVFAPVIWPICNEARKVCQVSAKVSDKMLSLPIDQRYDYDDIEDIAEVILSCI